MPADTTVAFLSMGKFGQRKRFDAFKLWSAAWGGLTPSEGGVGLSAELFTSVHVFRQAEIKAFQDAQAGRTAGLVDSDVPHAVPAIVWDIDVKLESGGPDDVVAAAMNHAERLVRHLGRTFGIDPAGGLIRLNLSGSKGVHVRLWNPAFDPANPNYSAGMAAVHKRFALALATEAGVVADPAIYAPGNLIRLPNSRHPRTGRHAVPVDVNHLLDREHLAIIDPAATPWVDASRPLRTSRLGWPVSPDAIPAGFKAEFERRWQDAAVSAGDVAASRLEAESKARGTSPGTGGVAKFRPSAHLEQVLSRGILDKSPGEGQKTEVFQLGGEFGELGVPMRTGWGLISEAVRGSGFAESDALPHFRNGWRKGSANRRPGWDAEL